MTQSWVVVRVRWAAPQDGVVTGEKAAMGELRHSSSS